MLSLWAFEVIPNKGRSIIGLELGIKQQQLQLVHPQIGPLATIGTLVEIKNISDRLDRKLLEIQCHGDCSFATNSI